MAKRSTWNSRKARAVMHKVGMKALHEEAELILSVSISETPIDKGILRASGAVTDAPKEDAVYISFNTPYAAAVHEGYGPHEITVDTKKVLAVPTNRWKGGPVNPYGSGQLPCYSKNGEYVILGRRVKHPGFTGVKYLENPFNRMKDKAMKNVKDKILKALKDAKE